MSRILGLDGVRAIAALMVVVTHLHIFVAWHDSGSPLYSLVWGVNGVKIFFVLSGFLITHLLLTEQEKHGRIQLKLFLIRRSLRIFPLFYLFILSLMIAGIFFETKTSGYQLLISSIYGFNFIPRADYNITLGHTWSLAVEEHFYLIWPPLVIFIIQRSNTFTKLLFATTTIYVLLELLNYHLYHNTNLDSVYNIGGWTTSAARFILAGCWGAVLIHTNTWHNISGTKMLNYTLIIVFLMGYFVDFWYDNNPIIVRNLYTFGVLSGILLIVNNQDWLIVKVFELPPIRYLGQVSYGIYVWQGFYLATGPGREYGQNWPPNPVYGLFLLCITVPISYHFFESKFLKLKDQFRPE